MPTSVGSNTVATNSAITLRRGTCSSMPVSSKKSAGTMNGDRAVLIAFSTAARATFPRASSTRRGADTSVGSVPTSVCPRASGPAPKNTRPVSNPARDIGPYTKANANTWWPGRRRTTRTALASNVRLTVSMRRARSGEIPLASAFPSEGASSPSTVVITTRSSRLDSMAAPMRRHGMPSLLASVRSTVA